MDENFKTVWEKNKALSSYFCSENEILRIGFQIPVLVTCSI